MRKKDDEKRSSIKQAVVQVILEQGIHGASISKIAKSAGVSPATLYIYYENKDVMLREIYQEYAEDLFYTVINRVDCNMPAEQFIDSIIRAYYAFINSEQEIYHFIELVDSCPSLKQGCCEVDGPQKLNDMIAEYKKQGAMNDYNIANIWAIIFYPVKSIAQKSCTCKVDPEAQLNEMIGIIQKALLK